MASRERPILFSGPMVRAILEGRKTQTRRTLSPAVDCDSWHYDAGDGVWFPWVEKTESIPASAIRCPFGFTGDTLWVRETWTPTTVKENCVYRADFRDRRGDFWDSIAEDDSDVRWRPSIFMPRHFSRISLCVVSVRVERLQDISESDAKAEGIEFQDDEKEAWRGWRSFDETCLFETALESFREGWDRINGKRAPWSSNPWVWVVSFERIEGGAR